MWSSDAFDCEGCQKEFNGDDAECEKCMDRWMEQCRNCEDQSLCERCFFICDECLGCEGCDGEGDADNPDCRDCSGCKGCDGCGGVNCETREELGGLYASLHGGDDSEEIQNDEIGDDAEMMQDDEGMDATEEAKRMDETYPKVIFIAEGGRRPLTKIEQSAAKCLMKVIRSIIMMAERTEEDLLKVYPADLVAIVKMLAPQFMSSEGVVCEMCQD